MSTHHRLFDPRLYAHGGFRRFTILRELARGGMSIVYEAYDAEVDRLVALKILRSDSRLRLGETLYKRRRNRFFREADILARLDHPGILPVLSLGENRDKDLFFAMPVVRGQTLRSLFEGLKENDSGKNRVKILHVFLQICRTMAFVHSRGVIHRDLKPDNILVGPYGETYVMDWGLAKIADKPELHLDDDSTEDESTATRPPEKVGEHDDPEKVLKTRDGMIVGTLGYIAPEQASGRLNEVDHRSDVYALGAMLYELISHTPPYIKQGEKPDADKILHRIQQGPPEPLHQKTPSTPSELIAICDKAMAPKSEERYNNVEELADDIYAFLENRVVRAYHTGPFIELYKWIQRNRAFAAAVAVTFLVFIGSLATIGLIEHRRRSTAQRAEMRETAAKREAMKARDDEAETLRRVLRLSDRRILSELTSPRKLEAIVQGFDVGGLDELTSQAGRLCERLPLHQTALTQLRNRGIKSEELSMITEEHYHPLTQRYLKSYAQWKLLNRELIVLRSCVTGENAATPHNRAIFEGKDRTLRCKRNELLDLYNRLEEKILSDGHWRFENPQEQWVHDTLASLVFDLEQLPSTQPVMGFLPQLTLLHKQVSDMYSNHNDAWKEMSEEISDQSRSPRFFGFHPPKIPGLVPLGKDPLSGLWEFAHILSGSVPARDAKGMLQMKEDSAMVFVLVPPSGPPPTNGKKGNSGNETASRTNRVAPFLISKFEVTQGQWLHLTGKRPSQFGPGCTIEKHSYSLLHPVEHVNAEELYEVFRKFFLYLPTPEQWRHAGRGGSTYAWPTGDAVESLAGHVNLRDCSSHRSGGFGPVDYETWLDDGYLLHAPVGTYKPNGYGLHDMIGNVAEWCIGKCYYGDQVKEKDHRFVEAFFWTSPVFGGSFMQRARRASIDTPQYCPRTLCAGTIGFRPVIRIRPRSKRQAWPGTEEETP